jgi:DNA-binding transcriptional ArsR family regulator
MIRTKPKPSSKAKSGLSMELEEMKKAALTLRALNHKVRQQILGLIHERGEITVSEIYAKLKLEQSLTSSYLAVLRRANIVKTRREGQSIHYSVNYDHISMVEKGAKMINGRS